MNAIATGILSPALAMTSGEFWIHMGNLLSLFGTVAFSALVIWLVIRILKEEEK